jgi:hypothetical protein
MGYTCTGRRSVLFSFLGMHAFFATLLNAAVRRDGVPTVYERHALVTCIERDNYGIINRRRCVARRLLGPGGREDRDWGGARDG